jgi:transposase-like protein
MTKQKKSRRARRSFSPECKADVVRLCQSNGEKVGDVAKPPPIGVSTSRASSLLRQYSAQLCVSTGPSKTSFIGCSMSLSEKIRPALRIETPL